MNRITLMKAVISGFDGAGHFSWLGSSTGLGSSGLSTKPGLSTHPTSKSSNDLRGFLQVQEKIKFCYMTLIASTMSAITHQVFILGVTHRCLYIGFLCRLKIVGPAFLSPSLKWQLQMRAVTGGLVPFLLMEKYINNIKSTM